MKNVVVFTGAGISAESGLKTFRDSDGLWENYRIEDVATPEAWNSNPALVQDFYNMRRKQVLAAQPNSAHLAIAQLEKKFNVTVITQNVDDLHERAGSSSIIHLHGVITKARSTLDPSLIYDIEGWQLPMGATCEKGSQLRPCIVWFGEPVPKMEEAIEKIHQADRLVIIGTSLQVYPAASLLYYFTGNAGLYYIDPKAEPKGQLPNLTIINQKATEAIPGLVNSWLNEN